MIKLRLLLICALIPVFGLGVGVLVSVLPIRHPQTRSITIQARRYAYDPPIIRVNKGDKINLTFSTEDVAHGFYLEGYDIDVKIFSPGEILVGKPSEKGDYKKIDTITFTADRVGKFRYRCSLTCGYLHPFMIGEFVVEPNYPYTGGMGLLVGIIVGTVLYLAKKEEFNEKTNRSI